MSIKDDREQNDRTFRAVTATALVLLGVWFLFATTLWVIGA